MPKKKPIARRLEKLFEDVNAEKTPAEQKPASRKRAAEETPALQPAQTQPASKSVLQLEMAGRVSALDSAMSMAFQSGQDSWATLQVLDETEQRKWTPDEQLLVKQVADQLSLALENARLFQETQRRAQEMSALAEVGREVSATLNLEKVLNRIAEYARSLLQVETSAVYLPDPQGSKWTAISAVGNDAEEIKTDPIETGRGILGNIVLTKVGRIVNDASNRPDAITIAGTVEKDFEHIMGVPILSGDRVTGLMAVWRTGEGKDFARNELEFLSSLSQQAAVAIENARLFENAQYNAAIEGLISQVSSGFVNVSAEEVDAQINHALQKIGEFSHIDRAYLFQFAEDRKTMDNTHEWVDEGIESYINDFRNVPMDVLPYMLGHIQKMQIFYAPSVKDLPDEASTDRAELLRERIQSIICVPIVMRGKTQGFIGFDSVNQPKVWNDQDINMLRLVGEILTGALQRQKAEFENRSLFQEVTKSQSQLSEALRIAQIGYFEIDLGSRAITFTDELFSLLNTSAEEEGGYQFPLDQIMKKFVLAEDIPLAARPVRDAINAQTDQGSLTSEVRYKTGDGKVIWVSSTYKIERDLSGQAVKIAGSSQDITERKTNELTQAAITQISEAALAASTVVELIKTVHQAVGTLVPARNFYIALYDPTADLMTFPYYVDERDRPMPPQKLGRGLTSYVIRTGKPLRSTPEIYAELEASGEVVSGGTRGVDWLGVPLRSEGAVKGVMAVQSYDRAIRITQRHQEILTLLGTQVAAAMERLLAREALAKSEADLRALFSSMQDVVLVIDKDTRYVRVAPTNPSRLFRPPEELLGKRMDEILPPETYEPFRKAIRQALDTDEVVQIEYELPIEGREYWFLANLSKLNEEQVFWVARDITERKKSEEALAASRQMLRQVLDTIPSRVFWKDHNLNFMGSNQAFALDAGLKSPEELVGKNDFEMIWAEQANLYQSDDRAVMESQEPKLNFEEPQTDSDGRITWVRTTKVPLLNTMGKVDGILGIYDDVTAQKEAEEAIRRQNQYLAASSEIGRLVTSTLDLNTIFTRTVNLISERFGFYFAAIYINEEAGFNTALREATGGAGEKMKAQRHSVVIGFNSVVGKVAESGEPVRVNDVAHEALYHPNPLLPDTRSEVAISMRIGSRIVGVIDIQSTEPNAFTENDISVLQSLADQVAVAIDNARSYELSQQLIRELREVDLLKSQFLANMSHELRTPLNSIIGFSRVILKGIDGPVTDMQQQDLTAIYNSGQHLLGLINDVLDLARIEAGKMELNFEEVHLAEMATSVMSTAKGLVKEKPIHLMQRIPADMPRVRGDTMRVRQVLLNLISNATKFTDEGSITVEAVVQKSPTGRMEALINVIDTGPGIAPEDQEKLFKAFSQVDGSATRKSGGSGLGLSICANLVQLHGGRIGIHSEMGKGSVFWFTLPLFHQPQEEIPEGRKVVLAIDDDPQVIGLYERYLNPQGYYVVPLTDPSRAKQRILEIKPYAVTLDIMMPNVDGWTVLNELKSDPATRDVPVIVCSIMEQADKGFNLGASDYLVKPILEEDLVHALNRLNRNGSIREVLVIDDDPNDLRLIEKILGEHGQYKPTLAEGGRKGWEAMNQKAPDAIILDIFMPDMDGFTILEKLRENPALSNIPVLVVSGGGLTNEQQKQLSDFGQRLITKGSLLKEGELISSIENALRRIG